MLKEKLKNIDFFIPEELKTNNDEWIKSRYLIVLSFSSALLIIFSLLLRNLGFLDSNFNFLFGISYVVLPFIVLWISRKLKPAFQLFALLTLINLNLTISNTGGILSSTVGWLSIYPILTLIMLGFKDALAWTIIVILNLVTIYLFSDLSMTSILSMEEYFFNHGLMILFSVFFVYLFWNSQKILVAKLKNQRLTLETKNQLLEAQTNELQEARLALTNSNKTLEIQNNQLNQSQIDLIESNQSLQRYAHTVSHDLKEPLRSMSSFAQLLHRHYKKSDLVDEKAQEYFDFVLSSTFNMNELISESLEFSKSSFKKKNFKPIDLNKTIQVVKQNLSNQINEAQVEIINGELPKDIYGMEIPIAQLFQNIISNAIKFRKPHTKPVIEVFHNEKKTEWIISIKDNGIGIKEHDSANIFQEFHKLHQETDFEGQGIGLTTCQKIIKQHDGNIWLESEYGKGTTFYFSLPKIQNTVNNVDAQFCTFQSQLMSSQDKISLIT